MTLAQNDMLSHALALVTQPVQTIQQQHSNTLYASQSQAAHPPYAAAACVAVAVQGSPAGLYVVSSHGQLPADAINHSLATCRVMICIHMQLM